MEEIRNCIVAKVSLICNVPHAEIIGALSSGLECQDFLKTDSYFKYLTTYRDSFSSQLKVVSLKNIYRIFSQNHNKVVVTTTAS
ncbi:MAG: hypothetical protein WCO84_00670 [bacterium]